MTNDATYIEERKILELATPRLKIIYGDFEIDEEQRDRPDAAIILHGDGDRSAGAKPKKIGIEITTIDQPQDMQYLNDEKYERPLVIDQLNMIASGGTSASSPNKKISIEFPDTYISDGVAKKASKHESYGKTSEFDELIVLAFSGVLDLNEPRKRAYHAESCSYHLGKISFPYDLVIFVSTCNVGDASVVVYQKSCPRIRPPQRDKDMEAGVEVMKSPVLKMGESFNLYDLFENSPALTPKKKNKKKR